VPARNGHSRMIKRWVEVSKIVDTRQFSAEVGRRAPAYGRWTWGSPAVS
jgi:hypothetical protein